MSRKYYFTAHALLRIRQNERTVLFEDEICEVLEDEKYVQVSEFEDVVALLFYSLIDLDFYVLICIKENGAIKTVLNLHMYQRKISDTHLKCAKSKAIINPFVVYVIAKMMWLKGVRKGETYTQGLGKVISSAKVNDLETWITQESSRTELEELLKPHLSTKGNNKCLSLSLRTEKKRGLGEVIVPWN